MKIKLWLAVLTAVFNHSANASESITQKFHGTWELVALQSPDSNGNWQDIKFEDHPDASFAGIITYDDTGYMSAQIATTPRTLMSTDENPEMINGYIAYYAKYSIEEESTTISHLRLGHVNPKLIGNDAKRFYEFEDNKLILTLAPSRALRLVWQRPEPESK